MANDEYICPNCGSGKPGYRGECPECGYIDKRFKLESPDQE